MRRLLVPLLASVLLGGRAAAGDLDVEVSGLRDAVGELRIAVFPESRADRFPDPDSLVAGVRVQLSDVADVEAPLRVRIGGLRAGRYAVSAVHDRDANGILNRNALGIPTEGFAFSRAARGRFGPPEFESAAIRLDARAASVSLVLVY
jgi:uncharacterized protein (DUF2141 family)